MTNDVVANLEQAINDTQGAIAGNAEAQAEALVLRDLSLRTRKLRRAWARKQSLGLFGPSQAGKSFLVGALLSHELGTLEVLSREARLSPYHFLRTFQMLTGVTPHQYLLRVRLRHAALRLASHSSRILDVALDCGFGDLSSFNRAFRAEYGVNPRRYRGDGRIGRPAEPEPKPF